MAEEADSSGGENSTWTKAESTFNKYEFFFIIPLLLPYNPFWTPPSAVEFLIFTYLYVYNKNKTNCFGSFFFAKSKRYSEYFDPCQEAASRSMRCLHRNRGDREFCSDFFQSVSLYFLPPPRLYKNTHRQKVIRLRGLLLCFCWKGWSWGLFVDEIAEI